jgi:hypothetical protein
VCFDLRVSTAYLIGNSDNRDEAIVQYYPNIQMNRALPLVPQFHSRTVNVRRIAQESDHGIGAEN